MMLKCWLGLALVLVTCASIAQAQGRQTGKRESTKRPNLSGIWEFDASESVGNELAVISSSNIKNLVSIMTVTHNEPLIEIIENEEFELANRPDSGRQVKETRSRYFTDGRGEVNVLGIEYRTKTRWVGNKLVLTTYSWAATAGKTEPVSRISIELSNDGSRLFKRFTVIAANKKEEKEFKRFEAVLAYKRRNN